MKKIIYYLVLTLCAISFLGCATIDGTVENNDTIGDSNQKTTSSHEEIPTIPEDIANASWLGIISQNENNYYLPAQLIQNTNTNASAPFNIKDVNIFLNDLEKAGVKEQPLPDEFSNHQERAIKDGIAAQVFALYYTAFNNGKGNPIDFCLGDVKYSKENKEHNGWSVSYLLFHATHKKNYLTGQYEVDKMEYKIFIYE